MTNFSKHSVAVDFNGDVSEEKVSKNWKRPALIGLGIMCIGLAMLVCINTYSFLQTEQTPDTQLFDNQGRYILRDYDVKKPTSNFLNGLGGFWGVPMWAFYVNRGQAITSFGKQNKDGAMLKFVTAEKAYQETPFTGFRTFMKGTRNEVKWNHMPFFVDKMGSPSISRHMMIGSNELEIEETAADLGVKTNIAYFTVVDEDYPSLIRETTITNTDAYQPLDIEVLDGLGRYIPAGLSNYVLDAMGRTMEAWMNVYNTGIAGSTPITQPFFHISQGTADTPQVQLVNDGNFMLSYLVDNTATAASEDLAPLLPIVVDPSVVFGMDTTLTSANGFFTNTKSIDQIVLQPQGTTSRTPCAFAGTKMHLAPGANVTIVSIYGHADNLDQFLSQIAPNIRKRGYTLRKRSSGNALVQSIQDKVATNTSSPLFNAYVKQDFLDNVLRGGLPVTLGASTAGAAPAALPAQNTKVYHTFSRIHGDIERDYNNFQIDTSYYSQGPGNFRDVNQNRRLDVWHSPSVGDMNVHMFLSFVQADGYNPLTVASTNFKVSAAKIEALMGALQSACNFSGINLPALQGILTKPFRPGSLFQDMVKASLPIDNLDKAVFLNTVIAAADQEYAAQYAQNGFWADHWTYTLDLVENYLSIYPDREEHLLWDSAPVPFFMSPAYVKPRRERYSLVPNPKVPSTSTIRVYNPIASWGDPRFSPERTNAMNAIFGDPNYIADAAGAGGVWQRAADVSVFTVSPIAKLAMLGVLKYSTMDPFGMGVEMEGGKPGWNDAMNGLPGLLGSGMPETYEMQRILRFVSHALKKYQRDILLPTEFTTFLGEMVVALNAYSQSAKDNAAELAYWDASNTAREKYRAATIGTFSGQTQALTAEYLISTLNAFDDKVSAGIAKALATNGGFSPTYFYYECTNYTILTTTAITIPAQSTQVKPLAFKLHTLPVFLEGPTRHLKVIDSLEQRRDVYNRARHSALYDSELQMYMICASLQDMEQEIGRMKAFSPGWLENQSIWLHMSYKFYLELLRGGLYEEFFKEMQTGLVPFMDNEVYGRSPIEAASFIVSSAFPDKNLHGASFLARLSGSTAEFLSMWAYMMAGPTPFTMHRSLNELTLSFQPILPGWLFNDDGTLSFTFLGKIPVYYHNPAQKNTWEIKQRYSTLTYSTNPSLPEVAYYDKVTFNKAQAESVRNFGVSRIDIYY